MRRSLLFCLMTMISLIAFAQAPLEKSFSTPAHILAPDRGLSYQPQYNPNLFKYDVTFYKIDLKADNTSEYLEGNVTIGAKTIASQLDTLVFELIPEYTIDSILLNNERHSFWHQYDDIYVIPSSPPSEGEYFEVVVFYSGSKNANAYWEGFVFDSYRDVSYTMAEPFYARAWFPCKQVLTDKADSVFLFITTDSDLKVAANGLLTDVVSAGPDLLRYEWKTFYPTAFYLISFCVGDYVEYNVYAKPNGYEDSILVQNFMYNENHLIANKSWLDLSAQLIEVFSDMFGLYPFHKEKYGHCSAPIGGAMEHQTITTMGGYSFELVAHELAHHWFGDYITCGTWSDIFINEGFATYAHFLALEHMNGEFPVSSMNGYMQSLVGTGFQTSIFIPEIEFDIDWTNESMISSLSSRIFSWEYSYMKGAVFLHMIRHRINNDELFFNALRDLVIIHQNGNATGIDFQAILENTTGMDFTADFDQWYFGTGYPIYDIEWDQQNDTLYIHSTQQTSSSATPLFKMVMDYWVYTEEDTSVLRLYQEQNVQEFKLYFPSEILKINIDPLKWSLKQVNSFNKVENQTSLKITSSNPAIAYPNPSNGRFTLQPGDNRENKICIRNMQGEVVWESSSPLNEINLDLSYLPAGIYFLEIGDPGEKQLLKLLFN